VRGDVRALALGEWERSAISAFEETVDLGAAGTLRVTPLPMPLIEDATSLLTEVFGEVSL
jgi:hypothetical protein